MSTPEDPGAAPSDAGGSFECNICFEPPTKPVLSRCGHVFWYGCAFHRPSRVTCPLAR